MNIRCDKKIEIICDFCKKSFLYIAKDRKSRLKRNPKAQAYCSTECRLSAKRTGQNINCENCGKEFYRLKSEPNRRFCSNSCAAPITNKERFETGFSIKGMTKEVFCDRCEKLSIQAINTNSIYCSGCSFIKDQERRAKIAAGKNARPILGDSFSFEKDCIDCGNAFVTKTGVRCLPCKREDNRKNGCKTASVRKNIKRSKNEIYFAELCSKQFSNVKTNEPMFDGWDADVILPDLKIAIMWNGIWHYKKVCATHYLKQVRSRDKIKAEVIKECGYISYVIKDMGSHNPKFVEEQFEIFMKWTKTL